MHENREISGASRSVSDRDRPGRRKPQCGRARAGEVGLRRSTRETGLVFLPRHAIHSRGCFPLQSVEALPEQIDGDMVEQRVKRGSGAMLCG